MYLNWKWLVAIAAFLLLSGIAAAITGRGWQALINGVGAATLLWAAADDYDKSRP